MSPSTNFRVKVSRPRIENLSEVQNGVFEGIKAKLAAKNVVLVESATGLSIVERRDQINACHGLLVLGFALWRAERVNGRGKTAFLPSEFAHIETVMALTALKPVLVLREKSVNLRGVFRQGLMPPLNVDMPTPASLGWLTKRAFEDPFSEWVERVTEQRDVFLGYCGSAKNTARSIQLMLVKAGFSVLDWQEFVAGRNILTQISEAACRTSCGVFLFTKDDKMMSAGKTSATPRDNVVFEAGYFASAKGKSRTLIILEDGARAPADLGGDIYIRLRDRENAETIEAELTNSVKRCLEDRI
jgi:hypothetical protein